MRPTTDLRLLVGYDGSPAAERALNAAVNLLQGRTGRIEVVYVAHMSSMAALSPAAVTELETDFDEIEQELRTAVGEQLRGRVEGWDFERREGLMAEELLAAAKTIGAAHPDATVVIVVGSSKAPKRCSMPKRPSMARSLLAGKAVAAIVNAVDREHCEVVTTTARADGRRAGL